MNFEIGNRISSKDRAQIISELGLLLESGMMLYPSLVLLTNTLKKKKSKMILEGVANDLLQGEDFSSSMHKWKMTSRAESNVIRISEKAGSIHRALDNLSMKLKRKMAMRKKVLSSLSYPFLVLVLSILVIYFMLTFVVPVFSDVLARSGGELPPITELVMSVADWVSDFGWILIAFAMILISTSMFFYSKDDYRPVMNDWIMKLPFGGILNMMILQEFFDNLSFMMRSGMTLQDSLKDSSRDCESKSLSMSISRVQQAISAGSSLHESLSRNSNFDQRSLSLLKVAEESNTLERTFGDLASYFEQNIENRIERLGKIIEPLSIFLVSILVAVVLISLYLPMFKTLGEF